MLHIVIFIIPQVICLFASNEDPWITQFIRKYNYPVETHNVETYDGYFLTLFRIPYGLSNKPAREIALLVHGMSGSAENFVYLGPPDALTFHLADRGYDVWLFNARGTALSRKHRSLDPIVNRKKYWDFSWNEIGTIDLPTSINYILTNTSKETLYYVGHSQGSTSLLVMLSELPEMNEKIKLGVLLAASVKLYLTPFAALKLLTTFAPLAQKILELLSWHELCIPNSPMLNTILQFLCRGKFMTQICIDVLYTLGGGTYSGYFNKTLLPEILVTGPSGFAVRQIWHYSQVILTGEFKKYDFGKRKNLKVYNSTKPPLYDLSNVKAPIGIFYAEDDPFANEQMSRELLPLLPNIVLFHKVQPQLFNHLDYIFGSVAKEAIYDPLYELFQKYEDNI